MPQCRTCHADNLDDARFCSACGARVEIVCPACQRHNDGGARFCRHCGASLQHTVPAAPVGADVDLTRTQAERRQLTVLFCDLVDSTKLARRLDAEEWRELLLNYHEQCGAIVQGHTGHVAQYLGDGLLAYFGYPHAHEDDALRAVRAGLDIIQAVQRLGGYAVTGPLTANALTTHTLSVRIGIHTGPVVVGDMGGGDQLATGDTVNVASRLQGTAPPNGLVIGPITYRLVHRFFACQPLGRQSLKGIDDPIEAYRVLPGSLTRSRLEVLSADQLTPLVGREQETGLLLDRWQRAREGSGQVVLITGEPGIGKSRILQTLREHLADEAHSWLASECQPDHQNSAFYPIIDLLERTFGFRREDDGAARLAKLESTLAPYAAANPEMVPLLAALLSIPGAVELGLSPQVRRKRTLDALLSILRALAALQPLVVVMEDLHWMDPSSLKLLDLLVVQAPTARLLLVLTFRTEFHPTWLGRSHCTPIALNRLTRRQVEAMLDSLAIRGALPVPARRQIVDASDGVPLFVEEVAKAVLEAGASEHAPITVPVTLQDSLMTRLDRLGSAKQAAQLGAVIGREFNHELLQAAWAAHNADTLGGALGELVAAEVLYQRGTPPQATYYFKHALIQQTAYQSLLRSERQRLHRRVAEALVERFPETAEARPELVAQQYTEAGMGEQAIPYWQMAGLKALGRCANEEAIHHLRNSLDLLEGLPATPERRATAAGSHLGLAGVFVSTKGWASAQAEEQFQQARRICEELGDEPRRLLALWGLWHINDIRAQMQTSRDLAQQLIEAARRPENAAFLMAGRYAVGASLLWSGNFTEAEAELRAAVGEYDAAKRETSAHFLGLDPGLSCLGHWHITVCILGYPDQARARDAEVVARAEHLAHAPTLLSTLLFSGILHSLLRDDKRVLLCAERMAPIASENGFAFFIGASHILRGVSLASLGEHRAIQELEEGIRVLRPTGTNLTLAYAAAVLALERARIGDPADQIVPIQQTLAQVDEQGDRIYEAEICRILGAAYCLRSRSHDREDAGAAEHWYRRAIEIAAAQRAKLWELRAATSLARLWEAQGKRRDARALLAPVYGWFTEGFDTPDLIEAQRLLDALGS
jgi:class 3 adenylate cyclase/tetratricopeptide (TPR) repeat protein